MNNAEQPPRPPPARPSSFSEALIALQVSALKAVVLSVWAGSVIMAMSLFMRNGWSGLTFLTLFTSVCAGGMWLLLKRGQVQLATRCLVLVFLLVGTVGIVQSGSVRSAAT